LEKVSVGLATAPLATQTPTEFASQIAASRDLAETKTSRELTI
jgi:hypothetical protein